MTGVVPAVGGQEAISPGRLSLELPVMGTGHSAVRPVGGLAKAAPGVRCEVWEGVSEGAGEFRAG